MATENIDSGNQSTTDTGSASLLERSPWSRVINETGSGDAVLQGFGSATGGDTSGGAPSGAGGGAGSGNPFTNFGNPNASGSPLTGNTNPWAAINTSGSSAPSGGDTSGAGSTDVLTGASSGGDTSGASGFSGSAGGFGGGSQGGNFGGIDFGSATDSLSFQNRILIDQYIAAGPTEESTNVLSSQITDSIVNQVSLGSTTSSVDGATDTQFGAGNLNAGTDTQFGGSTQVGGDSIPFA
ncbi:MAG: hypothetical protein F6K28_04350 [Microcoleus sp. SIO2G3]|nr:hypothetical protein [Microcoleus sp. SIO2G3]